MRRSSKNHEIRSYGHGHEFHAHEFFDHDHVHVLVTDSDRRFLQNLEIFNHEDDSIDIIGLRLKRNGDHSVRLPILLVVFSKKANGPGITPGP